MDTFLFLTRDSSGLRKLRGIPHEQNKSLDFVHPWLTWQEKSPQTCTRSFKRLVAGMVENLEKRFFRKKKDNLMNLPPTEANNRIA
jgi:hypothetical protein